MIPPPALKTPAAKNPGSIYFTSRISVA
jgi:hypothetical protein